MKTHQKLIDANKLLKWMETDPTSAAHWDVEIFDNISDHIEKGFFDPDEDHE